MNGNEILARHTNKHKSMMDDANVYIWQQNYDYDRNLAVSSLMEEENPTKAKCFSFRSPRL